MGERGWPPMMRVSEFEQGEGGGGEEEEEEEEEEVQEEDDFCSGAHFFLSFS